MIRPAFQAGIPRAAPDLVQFLNERTDSEVDITPRPRPLTYRKIRADVSRPPRSPTSNNIDHGIVFVGDTLNLRTLTMFQPSPLAARREPDVQSSYASSQTGCSSRIGALAPTTQTCSWAEKSKTRLSAPGDELADAVLGMSKVAKTHSSARMDHLFRMPPVSLIGSEPARQPRSRVC